ncbi:hypothetical protein [Kineothrix sedimenti]|uniref:Uncharacterized protein n=1 Tax=Kineothrix sedimenti TaxID=3123317 RepID=A0ABZ3F2Q8_9FIRM
MKVAYILCNGSSSFDKSGKYDLVLEDGTVIGSHGCSNRSFANHDLTEWRLKELEASKVDIVMSGDKVVWNKDGDNSETMKEFYIANSDYEAVHCYGFSKNWSELSK